MAGDRRAQRLQETLRVYLQGFLELLKAPTFITRVLVQNEDFPVGQDAN